MVFEPVEWTEGGFRIFRINRTLVQYSLGAENMNGKTITIPQSVRAEIEKQAEQAPALLTAEDGEEFLSSLPPEIQGDAETHWNASVRLNEQQMQELERTHIQATKEVMRQVLVFSKPILMMAEAAELLGVSLKRLNNILYEEKARLGRLPDFVCDAGGILSRRVIKDELIEWIKRTRKPRGRPARRI